MLRNVKLALSLIVKPVLKKKINRDFANGVRRNYTNSYFNKFRTVNAVPALDITVAVDTFFYLLTRL